MANWILTDRASDRYLSSWEASSQDVPNAPDGFQLSKRTLRGGVSEGVDQIHVHNGRFEFTVLPTRGMGLGQGNLGGLPIGWDSPVKGPVHPALVPQTEPSGLGWLDGFDEWVCRCGAVSNGAPDFDAGGQLLYPLHGQIANLPAQRVEVSVEGDRITIRGVVVESRFHFHKLQLTTEITTRFNQPGLEIRDEVKNLSASEGEMQMLYHCNFGPPLLGAGAELVVPASIVAPRNDWAAEGIGHWSTYSEPVAGFPERVYFMEMLADSAGRTTALLKDAASANGVSLSWDVKQLPCFTIWKNETALDDGYVTGIEPGTNFPNPRTFEGEHGRVVKLAAGQSHAMRVGFTVHDTPEAVAKAQAAIHELQGSRAAEVHHEPLPNWSA